jgi:hypothetical protein
MSSIEEKLLHIQNVLKERNCRFVDLETSENVNIVYDLIQHRRIPEKEDVKSAVICVYVGWYYRNVVKTPALAEEWYLKGVSMGDGVAMYCLAHHYKNHRGTKIVEKYYRMAVEHGCYLAALDLAHLYSSMKSKTSLAKQFYTLAVTHNPCNSTVDAFALWYINTDTKYYHQHKCDFFELCFRFRNIVSRNLLLTSIERVLDIPHSLEIDQKIVQIPLTKNDRIPQWVQGYQKIIC